MAGSKHQRTKETNHLHEYSDHKIAAYKRENSVYARNFHDTLA